MIVENLKRVKDNLPDGVCLVAVSKTKPVALIQEAYDAGQRDFGENKAQEIFKKQPLLPKDIRWHFIGHLQTNKVKLILDKVFLIHSLDRIQLFDELEKQAAKINKQISVLIQFHVAQEETKHGFLLQDALAFLNSERFKSAKFVKIVGIMGMATNTDDKQLIRREFDTLKGYFEILKKSYFHKNEDFKILSMGMSGDYEIAIEAGSNMVRLGSSIFGNR
jgi:pyridoxal phosphate enzyme (YggS family)